MHCDGSVVQSKLNATMSDEKINFKVQRRTFERIRVIDPTAEWNSEARMLEEQRYVHD
jgi:hypothetical protein